MSKTRCLRSTQTVIRIQISACADLLVYITIWSKWGIKAKVTRGRCCVWNAQVSLPSFPINPEVDVHISHSSSNAVMSSTSTWHFVGHINVAPLINAEQQSARNHTSVFLKTLKWNVWTFPMTVNSFFQFLHPSLLSPFLDELLGNDISPVLECVCVYLVTDDLSTTSQYSAMQSNLKSKKTNQNPHLLLS